jgi:UrcA family protein
LVFNTVLEELIMTIQNTSGKHGMGKTLVVLAALSATMLAGVTQAAAPGGNFPKQVVTYRDLNLNSNAGIQVLYKRIQGAANQVCGKIDLRDLQGMSVKKACVERAISDAVAAVNSPMLTRVHLAKSGGHMPQSLPLAQVR